MPNATLRQVLKHARKVLNRTPTYELTAAKLRKGLKGRGIRTSAVFQLQCHPQGPLLCLQRLHFTSAKSFNFFNVTSAKQKPTNCFNSQVPSLQNCFQFSSATQRPGNCFNSQVPGKLAKCFNPQLPANCFHSQVPNKGLQTASIPTSQENL